MSISKKLTVGQVIRRIRSKEIANVYSLFGGDSFLEDFFLLELSKYFFKDNCDNYHYSMDQDSEENLFRELSAISMFEQKRIIIVREIKKLRTKASKEELIKYIENPNSSTVLVIINNEYDLKNALLNNIAKRSISLDLRPPFKEQMKKWVIYISKSRNITISIDAIDYFIQIFGDSIAHVINEIEKTSLLLNNKEINLSSLELTKGFDRIFYIWHLQDSLGAKNLKKSIQISSSLLENGISFNKILVSIFYLYQQIIWKKMGINKSIGFTGINKIITSKIANYNKKYSYDELVFVLSELQKTDILSKTSNIKVDSLMQSFIIKVCEGSYE